MHSVPPTSSDNVYFDANSFTVTGQIMHVDSVGSNFCQDMDWTGVTNQPTFQMEGIVQITGGFFVVA